MEPNLRRRALVEQLQALTPLSGNIYEQAKNYYPGGAVGGTTNQNPWPIYMASGDGAIIQDVDGNNYIDCCLGKGALLLGHNNELIQSAIARQNELGVMHSAPFASQVDFAKKIHGIFPCSEKVFLCNSGTEAVHKAIMIARAHTKKNWIAKFEGGFHGTYDQSCISVLAAGDNENAPESQPMIAGIPQRAVEDTLVLPFNNEAAFDHIKKHAGKLAAIIIEPVITIGLFAIDKVFLSKLQNIAQANNILVIFDEVLTGFRIGRGGCQLTYNSVPDIAAYGKALGGGMPIGAVGCKSAVLKGLLNATPPLRLGGTFSGNPMSLAAANAFLDITKDNCLLDFNLLAENCRHFAQSLNDKIHRAHFPVYVSHAGSMFFVHFTEKMPLVPRDLKNENMRMQDELCLRLRLNGVYAESAHTGFLSTAHTHEMVEKLIETYWKCLQQCFSE